jgi:hypothetical protein
MVGATHEISVLRLRGDAVHLEGIVRGARGKASGTPPTLVLSDPKADRFLDSNDQTSGTSKEQVGQLVHSQNA